ncbi:amino acid permease, partial [Mycobacterium sp. CBMA361]|nr:amino acid permease [Mycolicibacterium sp. CBMA 361]
LAPQTSVTVAAIIGVTVACCLAYVFYRNVYPIPTWPADVIPWIFLAVLLAAAAWYFAGPARIARRQTREAALPAEPAPEPAR